MLREGETYWICQNRDCRLTAVCDATECGMETQACRCGSLMKKKAHATVFSYLNFLREEESSENEGSKEEEETPCER
jgi:hypothetical protein